MKIPKDIWATIAILASLVFIGLAMRNVYALITGVLGLILVQLYIDIRKHNERKQNNER